MTDVYFFIGRLTYLILYFDPIVEASLETPEFAQYHYNKYNLEQQLNFNSEDPSTVMSIVFDLPTSFLNSSIAISSPNSTICMGNISMLNQSAGMLVT